MKTNIPNTAYCFSLILFFFAFISPSISLAADNISVSSLHQETQIVQGKIKAFNIDKQTILLKTVKGEKMSISMDWNTVLVGYSSSQEIEKGHGVKIWYSVKDKQFHAVKIEKKLDVGC